MDKILVINGPNLNMLGTREPTVYGADTLDEINAEIAAHGEKLGFDCVFFQSNGEGEIIDFIQRNYSDSKGIIINPGAYSHYSYAIRDCIASVGIPCVEVHISNIYAREEFRHTSVIAPVCIGQISGFGKHGYTLALDGLRNRRVGEL